jgi:hypothetical protein
LDESKETGDGCYPRYAGNRCIFFRIVILLVLCSLYVTPTLAQEFPRLRQVSPTEGHLGEELRLVLDGENLSMLEELTNVVISGIQIPFWDYEIIDDQTSAVSIAIPEQTPIGEQEISFIFNNDFPLNALFIVLEPEVSSQGEPQIYGIFPQEGRPGERLRLTLEGENLFSIGDLYGVDINDMGAEIVDYNRASNQVIEVLVRIPEDTPSGEGYIALDFENGEFEDYFVVFEPEAFPTEEPGVSPPEGPGQPALRALFPTEGSVESDLRLRLEGENLSQLSDLQAVRINGMDIDILDYQILSDQTIETILWIPAEIPTGSGLISFEFDNSDFRSPFSVVSPARFPIEVLIGVIAVIGILGLAGRRILRRPPAPEKRPSPETPTLPPQFQFIPHMDAGAQRIEIAGPSIKADIDIRLITITDLGNQYVEVEQDSLIAE